WAHHYEVAALGPDDQDALLDEAEEKGLRGRNSACGGKCRPARGPPTIAQERRFPPRRLLARFATVRRGRGPALLVPRAGPGADHEVDRTDQTRPHHCAESSARCAEIPRFMGSCRKSSSALANEIETGKIP